MRFLFVLLAALILVPVAQADHGTGLHWPTTTVQVNSGGCSSECRWIKVINRTGYSISSYHNTKLITALTKIQDATGGRFQWTVVRQSQLTVGSNASWVTAVHNTPLGAITLARAPSFPGAMAVPCDDPQFPETLWIQPYCGTESSHVTKGVVGVNTNSWEMTAHETMHLLGLGDAYLLPGCGVGGPGLMCQLDQPFFNAHDKALLAGLYGHAP